MSDEHLDLGTFEVVNPYTHLVFLGNAESPESNEDFDLLKVTGLFSDDPVPSIFTGVSTGTVGIYVHALEGPPSELPVGSWEDVAEMTVEFEDFPARALGPATDRTAGAVLNPSGAGLYRIRVSGTGRDLAWDLTSTTMDERYFVETWPVSVEEAPRFLVSTSSTSKRFLQT